MGISGSFRGARGCERGTMLGPNLLLDALYWAGHCMSKGLQTRRCVRSTPPRIGRDAIGARGLQMRRCVRSTPPRIGQDAVGARGLQMRRHVETMLPQIL